MFGVWCACARSAHFVRIAHAALIWCACGASEPVQEDPHNSLEYNFNTVSARQERASAAVVTGFQWVTSQDTEFTSSPHLAITIFSDYPVLHK